MTEKKPVITKKRVYIAIIAILVLFSLWYTRPMTVEQLCPELDLSKCEGINIRFYTFMESDPLYDPVHLHVTAGDPSFALLMEELEHRTFRRSLWNLFSKNTTKSHRMLDDDYMWDIFLNFKDVQIPTEGGYIGSGTLLRLCNSYGTLSLDAIYMEKAWRASTADQEQWLSHMMDIITEASANQP